MGIYDLELFLDLINHEIGKNYPIEPDSYLHKNFSHQWLNLSLEVSTFSAKKLSLIMYLRLVKSDIEKRLNEGLSSHRKVSDKTGKMQRGLTFKKKQELQTMIEDCTESSENNNSYDSLENRKGEDNSNTNDSGDGSDDSDEFAFIKKLSRIGVRRRST